MSLFQRFQQKSNMAAKLIYLSKKKLRDFSIADAENRGNIRQRTAYILSCMCCNFRLRVIA